MQDPGLEAGLGCERPVAAIADQERVAVPQMRLDELRRGIRPWKRVLDRVARKAGDEDGGGRDVGSGVEGPPERLVVGDDPAKAVKRGCEADLATINARNLPAG